MDHTAQTPVINGTVKPVLGVKQEGILSCYIPGSRIGLCFLLTKIHWIKDYVDNQILTFNFLLDFVLLVLFPGSVSFFNSVYNESKHLRTRSVGKRAVQKDIC